MAFVPADKVSMLELKYLYEGQFMENTFYYYDGTNALREVYESFNGQIQNSYDATVNLMQTNQLVLTGWKWTDLSAQDGTQYETEVLPHKTGADTSPGLPANCAAVITLHTASRGRSARGRQYIPGVPQTAHSAGLLTGTYMNHIAGWGTFWNSLTAGGLTVYQGVLSRYHNGVARSTAQMYLITSYTMNPTVCSQRRRLPGRGI